MSNPCVQGDAGVTAGVTRRFFVRVAETLIYEGYVDAETEEEAADIAERDYYMLPCITEEYGDFHPQILEITEEDD